MSAATTADEGVKALAARDYPTAITKLTSATSKTPNPSWLCSLSKAYIGSGDFTAALDAAEQAWHAAFDRSRRELIVEACHRRAVAHFRLKQYANADACCLYATRLIEGKTVIEKEDPALVWVDEGGFWTITLEQVQDEAKRPHPRDEGKDPKTNMTSPPDAPTWRAVGTIRMQAVSAMSKLPEGDEGRRLTAKQKPQKKNAVVEEEVTKKVSVKQPTAAATPKPVAKPALDVTSKGSTGTPEKGQSRRLEDKPIRTQDFQSSTTMSVSLFTKGVNKDDFKVKYSSHRVELGPLLYKDGEKGNLTLDLWGEIDPEKCSHTITPNKVELDLAKKVPGTWKGLHPDKAASAASSLNQLKPDKGEATEKPFTAGDKTYNPSYVPREVEDRPYPVYSNTDDRVTKHSSHTGPAYPTSSRTGPKDWDKIGAEAEDPNDNDPNAFFKMIYSQGDDDTRRAMMKSFTESNGTSLSTDWSGVKDKRVETVPPEGMEAKKYEK